MLFLGAALALSSFCFALAALPLESGRSTYDKRGSGYYATAHVANEELGISATFQFLGYDGSPTRVEISSIKGLTTDPMLGGPFLYHIHTNYIPADGNCTKALAHLDPLNVTEGFVCDPAFPSYCQTSNLSGKHGKLNGTESGKIESFGYYDDYVRFYPCSHSLLGRSIVIHADNKTRLACGNITSTLDGTADSSGPTYKPSTYVKNYPKTAPIQPSPPIIPFNGTKMTGGGVDPDVIASFPYPLPVPALPITKARNVKLGTITHTVKYANSEHRITQPKEYKSDAASPFRSSSGV
ncbi:hypothetical protein FRC10_007920 [Ceratobasidium sp. 414]|nr:hypothetical protein FRC10_007920 [Ceratobasidium sp. 414]